MVIIKSGDLLEAEEEIIVHQVNIDGIMGGGVARQIAEKFPNTEKEYERFCESHNFLYEQLKGKVCSVKENDKVIANMFSQRKDFTTDYDAMESALTSIRILSEETGLRIAMPYRIGCGIAKGDFNLVLDVISKVFKNYEVTLYKLENSYER